MKYIKQILLKWLLKGTWHICNHEFITKSASESITESICVKCNVQATTIQERGGRRYILVREKHNNPTTYSPWGENEKGCKGVVII